MKKTVAKFEVELNSGIIPLPSPDKSRVYCDAIGATVLQEQFQQWGYGIGVEALRSASIRLVQDKSIVRSDNNGSIPFDIELIGVFEITLSEDREALDVREGLK